MINIINKVTSVVALGSVSVRSLYGKSDELCLTHVGEGGELDQGVERHLDVREVLQGLVQEVSHDTAQDGLVARLNILYLNQID